MFIQYSSQQANEYQVQDNGEGSDIKRDGEWLTLQDWSPCSLACGGGISTLQRACVEPVGGGKPCEGSQIITKVCNPKDCQFLNEEQQQKLKEEKDKIQQEVINSYEGIKIEKKQVTQKKQQYANHDDRFDGFYSDNQNQQIKEVDGFFSK